MEAESGQRQRQCGVGKAATFEFSEDRHPYHLAAFTININIKGADDTTSFTPSAKIWRWETCDELTSTTHAGEIQGYFVVPFQETFKKKRDKVKWQDRRILMLTYWPALPLNN